ncbi:MAG: 4Fe-4S binding protein [Anaeromyxobacteraceae bacterium]
MTTGRLHRWRRVAGAAQAAAWFGLPFVTVGGESALRLDVPTGRLHAFGASFVLGEAWVVLLATLVLTFLFLAVTLLAGRVWCGWGCPQTVLGDVTRWIEPEQRKLPRRWRRPAGFALTALVSLAVGAAVVWYFVPPGDFFRGLLAGTLPAPALWGWLVTAGVLFLDLAFLRADFCATACPYAKLQGVLFDRHTLVVAYDRRRDADCVDCRACVRVCPTGIDIRDGLQMGCIACGQCIDACQPIMAKLKRAPDLVGYAHGEFGQPPRPLRPVVAALAGATVLLALLLGVIVARRPLLTVDAMADAAFRTRRAADGRVLAAYSVALENRGRAAADVSLAMAAGGEALELHPATLSLAAGERRQFRVVATARTLAPGLAHGELVAEARWSDAHPPERRSRPLAITTPGAH